MKFYSHNDPMALDKSGEYYCRHVMALTAENLHEKSEIAAELGYRDMLIDKLAGIVELLLARNQEKFTDPLMRAPVAVDEICAVMHQNPWISPKGVSGKPTSCDPLKIANAKIERLRGSLKALVSNIEEYHTPIHPDPLEAQDMAVAKKVLSET